MKTKKIMDNFKDKIADKKDKKTIKCIPSLNPFEKEFQKSLGKKYNASHSVETDLVKIFKTPYAPSSYNPRSDFYSYINYSWLDKQDKIAKTEKKKFYSQIDSFRLVQEKVYYELMDIVIQYTKINKSNASKNISDVYESLLHCDHKLIMKNMRNTIHEIDDIVEF